jgi:hypothetical protein
MRIYWRHAQSNQMCSQEVPLRTGETYEDARLTAMEDLVSGGVGYNTPVLALAGGTHVPT